MKKYMSNAWKMVIAAGLLFTCVACGPGLMMVTQPVYEVKPEKAMITFVRATKFGGASEFNVWDSMDYVGTIKGGQYIQKEVDPGEHMFIAHGQNVAYIKANLAPGKKYYIVLNVTIGFSRASVIPVPVTKTQDKYSQEDIDNWLAKLRPVTPHPEGSVRYVQSRQAQVTELVDRGNSPDAKFQTLAAEDFWN